jgi:hypothetical protein
MKHCHHWAYKCLQLTAKQQRQLHMNLDKAQGESKEQQKETHQLQKYGATARRKPNKQQGTS